VRHSRINWALADQSMVSGANFVTTIVLARYLGIEEFGLYALVWMAVLFVNSLQHAMVNMPMMSIGPKQADADLPEYYGAVFVQQAAYAALSFTLLWLGAMACDALFPAWGITGLALPLAFAGAAFQMQDFLRRYFFARGRSKAAMATDAVSYLGQIFLLLVLILFVELRSAGVLWVIGVTSAVAGALALLAIEGPAWNAAVFWAVLARHWRFSRWLTASALMRWMSGNFFIIAAAAVLGAPAAGMLKAAQNIVGGLHVLFFGLENVIPVRAAEIHGEQRPERFIAYILKSGLGLAVATFAVCAVLAILSEPILRLAYGEMYADAAWVLRWLCVAYVVTSLSLTLRYGLQALERTSYLFASNAVATAATLIAVFPLVKFFGVVGAPIGMAIVQSLMFLFLIWAFDRESRRLTNAA
jgi:O-antigen/teichoic acid export membrane protein